MLCMLIYLVAANKASFSSDDRTPAAFIAIVLILPFHLFAMACMLYSFYFCARALKAAEWQRPVTFGDFAGEFFLVWFFPVGIWMLQPRINRQAAQSDDGQQFL
jgi:hypothetical protein